MKTLSALFLCAFLLLPLSGAVLKKGMEKPYTIVYADKVIPPVLRWNRRAAENLQALIGKAAGIQLHVLPESRFSRKGPAFYIGDTQAAAEKGLLPKEYARWEHHVRILKGDVFLYGADRPGKVWPNTRDHLRMELGSTKAMTVFLERFAGAVFAGSPDFRDSVLPGTELAFPDEFRYDCKPFFLYNTGRRRDLLTDMGQNGFYPTWYGTYGGHSHPKAVPMDKLFKEHPEYFALQRGKRNPGRQNQLCLSNQAVQELIYKEVLNHLDQGFDMVQLAQSDGFCPCECEKCRDWYGVKPTAGPKDLKAFRADPAWGEKIWRLHKSMADRLLKDRPGKKVCIIAYGPTRKPPQGFREFPDNVMIELAPFSKEILQAWKGYKVPAGFVVYLYNWGFYKVEGLLPKMNWENGRKQIQDFYAGNIHGIYRCGHGELYGTEGVTYYLWGQMLQNPDLDIAKAVRRYCRVIFPGAEKEMEQFYTLLDQRLAIQNETKEQDWNDPDLLNGKKLLQKPAWILIQKRYPETVIAELDSLLTAAEKKLSPEKCQMLRLVRLEFDYMKYTVQAVHALVRFRKSLSAADWKAAQKPLALRQKLIDSLPFRDGKGAYVKGMPLFGGISREMMMDGGRLRAPLGPPFTWNNRWYAEHLVQPAGRVMKVNDETPQYLVPEAGWLPAPAPVYTGKAVKAFCRYADGHLKVVFLLENETYENAVKHELQIRFQAPGGKMYRMAGGFRNRKGRCAQQKLSTAQNQGKGPVWESSPVQWSSRIGPVPGLTLKEGEIAMEVDIDLAKAGLLPKKGDVWNFNLLHIVYGRSRQIWEHNFEQRSWRNTADHTGKLIFQGEKR